MNRILTKKFNIIDLYLEFSDPYPEPEQLPFKPALKSRFKPINFFFDTTHIVCPTRT